MRSYKTKELSRREGMRKKMKKKRQGEQIKIGCETHIRECTWFCFSIRECLCFFTEGVGSQLVFQHLLGAGKT